MCSPYLRYQRAVHTVHCSEFHQCPTHLSSLPCLPLALQKQSLRFATALPLSCEVILVPASTSGWAGLPCGSGCGTRDLVARLDCLIVKLSIQRAPEQPGCCCLSWLHHTWSEKYLISSTVVESSPLCKIKQTEEKRHKMLVVIQNTLTTITENQITLNFKHNFH